MHFGPTFVEAFGQLTSSRANTPRLDFIRTILEVRPRPQPVLGWHKLAATVFPWHSQLAVGYAGQIL